VSRRQVLALGGTAVDIRRMRRRRELCTIHEGVYVHHTGLPSRRQREWAAVLACWPAALHRQSALDAHGMTRDRHLCATDEPVDVMVDASRRVDGRPGIRVERVVAWQRWIQPGRSPARARVEFALLKEASTLRPDRAVALLADGCRQGLTTASRLTDVLDRLPRLPQRSPLREVLEDVATGTHSLLEQRYLRDVERAHGLPPGDRQVRIAQDDGVVFRDVHYPDQRALVELDGRFGHTDTDDRWDDLDRDLAAAMSGQITVRLGWRQVLQPCRVAAAVAAILTARGWTGTRTACGPECRVDGGTSGSPRAPDPPETVRGA